MPVGEEEAESKPPAQSEEDKKPAAAKKLRRTPRNVQLTKRFVPGNWKATKVTEEKAEALMLEDPPRKSNRTSVPPNRFTPGAPKGPMDPYLVSEKRKGALLQPGPHKPPRSLIQLRMVAYPSERKQHSDKYQANLRALNSQPPYTKRVWPVDAEPALLSSSSGPVVRILWKEHQAGTDRWSTHDNHVPWDNPRWVKNQIYVWKKIQQFTHELKIVTPRDKWPEMAAYLKEDEAYLSMYPDDWTSKSRKEQLKAERIVIIMVMTSIKKDETVEELVEIFRTQNIYCCRKIALVKKTYLVKLLEKGGLQNRTADYLISASRIIVDNGCVPADGEWILALPGIGRKMTAAIMSEAFSIPWGIATDSHLFAIARAVNWVNDGDRTDNLVSRTLQQWVPSDSWYKMNMLMAGLGQILDRSERAGDLVRRLLRDKKVKPWIVRVCTSPHYCRRAYKFVEEEITMRGSELACHVLCDPVDDEPGWAFVQKPAGKKNLQPSKRNHVSVNKN